MNKQLIARQQECTELQKALDSDESDELGFQYPQHFSRLFKRLTGTTPNEYRDQEIGQN